MGLPFQMGEGGLLWARSQYLRVSLLGSVALGATPSLLADVAPHGYLTPPLPFQL